MPRDTATAPLILPLCCTSGGSRTSTISTLPSLIFACASAGVSLRTAAFASAISSFTPIAILVSLPGDAGRPGPRRSFDSAQHTKTIARRSLFRREGKRTQGRVKCGTRPQEFLRPRPSGTPSSLLGDVLVALVGIVVGVARQAGHRDLVGRRALGRRGFRHALERVSGGRAGENHCGQAEGKSERRGKNRKAVPACEHVLHLGPPQTLGSDNSVRGGGPAYLGRRPFRAGSCILAGL